MINRAKNTPLAVALVVLLVAASWGAVALRLVSGLRAAAGKRAVSFSGANPAAPAAAGREDAQALERRQAADALVAAGRVRLHPGRYYRPLPEGKEVR